MLALDFIYSIVVVKISMKGILPSIKRNLAIKMI